VSNLQEIRARDAKTVVIAEEGDDAVVPFADAGTGAADRRCCSHWCHRAAAGLRVRAGLREGSRRSAAPAKSVTVE
jgi:hypothetical protein